MCIIVMCHAVSFWVHHGYRIDQRKCVKRKIKLSICVNIIPLLILWLPGPGPAIPPDTPLMFEYCRIFKICSFSYVSITLKFVLPKKMKDKLLDWHFNQLCGYGKRYETHINLRYKQMGANTNYGGFHIHLLVFPFVYQFNSRIEALVWLDQNVNELEFELLYFLK